MGLRLCKILAIAFLIAAYIPDVLNADYDLRKDKRNQISNYKNDVAQLEREIRENELQISRYKAEIEEFTSELKLLSKLIGEVEEHGVSESDSLFLNELEINRIKEKLDPLRENFKKKVIWLYKYGSDYETEILFTSKSLDNLYARMIYLNKISGIRKTEFDRIKESRFLMEEKKKLLSLQSRQRLGYISTKKEDQRTLYEKKILTENIVANLEDHNLNLKRQIDRLNENIKKIETRLANLGTEFIYEIKRNPEYTDTSFVQLKGKLILPVQSVDIVEDFGTYVNPNTLAVSYNNGIDVSIAKGSEVAVVADGIVETVTYIPSVGNVLIINHGNEYRTVYGLVDGMTVQAGEEVNAGDIIAFTSENIDGQAFHFELWNGKQPENPKFWFRRN